MEYWAVLGSWVGVVRPDGPGSRFFGQVSGNTSQRRGRKWNFAGSY